MTLNAIPLHRLVQSRSNARQTGRRTSLGELVCSIRSHGLRQNLNVRPITGGRYEVVAGGRRLLALKQLARAGTLPSDHLVPCQLLTATDNPLEISLAENAVRQPMHPDDQATAFATLVAAGSSLDDVAARFGVTATVVRQRLKLAAVAPALRARFRQGQVALDQMMAFALVDDQAAQEAAWNDLPEWNRGPDAIRRVLTRSAIPSSHRLARFVGLEVYEAFGGPVIRDLFGGPDQCFLADGHLLERLATDRLTGAAEEVRQEGWSWVTIEPDLDWGASYDRVYPQTADDGSSIFSPDDLARAGARLSVNPDGSRRIDRGLVRPETVHPARRRRSRGHDSQLGSTLPARLIEELTAHRTAALRVELAGRPDLALAATIHALALGTLYGRPHSVASCLALTGTSVPLENHVQNSEDGLAHHALADLQATWLARLPPDPTGLWDWCIAQEQGLLLDLLAFVAALTINVVKAPREPLETPRRYHADQVSAALALDMTNWWHPTAEGFCQRVSKAFLAEALTELGEDGLAIRVRAAKKLEAAKLAGPALAAARWLPTPLRITTEPRPSNADNEPRA